MPFSAIAGCPAEEESFMRSRTVSVTRSYGNWARLVQRFAAASALAAALLLPAAAAEKPIKIVALGDSLSAGYQLPMSAAFPAQLEKALKAKGVNVEVANAGVSGDTASGGLSRLDWSVPDGTDAVIVELGANDMLRNVDPKVTRAALEQIVTRLKQRGIKVLLAGMRSVANYGEDYAKQFNAIYPELATTHNLVFYPFFLDGIAADAKLNQRDGLHPTEAGVETIVTRIIPKVEELIARVRAKRGS
jgi:acyl-CoA thioesterase-1